MLITTDAEIPGRGFTRLGLVLAEGYTGLGGSNMGATVNLIAQQATALGANAIVGLAMFRMGEFRWTVYGNAIRLE